MPAERGQIRTLIIIFALGLTFVLGMWLPFRAKRLLIKQQLSALDADIDSGHAGTAGLAELGEKIVLLNGAVSRFDKTVPEQPELATMLRELTGKLEEQEVVSLNVVPGTIVEGDAYCFVPITMSFRGSFQSLFGLLRHIESMDRLVQINTIEATGTPERPGEPLAVRVELSPLYAPAVGDGNG